MMNTAQVTLGLSNVLLWFILSPQIEKWTIKGGKVAKMCACYMYVYMCMLNLCSWGDHNYLVTS